MKKILKWAGIIFVILVIFSIVFGNNDSFEVELSENIAIENEKVIIDGKTNLMDGTLLSYEVDNYESTEAGEGTIQEGDIEVQDGNFSEKIDISEFEGNDVVTVWLGFRPIIQPEKVQEEYGEEGEKLKGDLVENGQIDIEKIFE